MKGLRNNKPSSFSLPVFQVKYLIMPKPHHTTIVLDAAHVCHRLKLRATDPAPVFDEFGARTCCSITHTYVSTAMEFYSETVHRLRTVPSACISKTLSHCIKWGQPQVSLPYQPRRCCPSSPPEHPLRQESQDLPNRSTSWAWVYSVKQTAVM